MNIKEIGRYQVSFRDAIDALNCNLRIELWWLIMRCLKVIIGKEAVAGKNGNI